MSEQIGKCGRPTCHCPARIDSDYCSEYCRRAEEEIEPGCLCGHPICQATHATTTIPGLRAQALTGEAGG